MYDDAFTIQKVNDSDAENFDYVSGMATFIIDMVNDVCIVPGFLDLYHL